ncbi:hypothetical protein [Parasediminibacterium sp. JCM 36343]|uniref:hypothetical protein n=1 Tax=Parasediminibacterium sp. JCM 36343 TaxID=3374279 RepID=UPI003979766B
MTYDLRLTTYNLKAFVLAPYLQTGDAHIDYYYDFTQSIAEYTAVFAELGIDWQWQEVTTENYTSVIDTIVGDQKAGNVFPIVLNLCDGDEVNGTPGISVINYLNKKGLVYTGADATFYDITTSKIAMKKAFDTAKVATPKWKAIYTANENHDTIFEDLGSPIMVKPAVAGGSMGVGVNNVVASQEAFAMQLHRMFEGYRGWQLTSGGIVAESFINGDEFTVFLVGNHLYKEEAIIYPSVKRVFHHSLPEVEKFLSFDRLWEIYEEETAMPNNDYFYEYALPDSHLEPAIQQIAWDAFVAVKGTGYARIDIRQDKATDKLYVLEVNAQCGISKDEDYTSIGAILKFANVSFTELVARILNNNNKQFCVVEISSEP